MIKTLVTSCALVAIAAAVFVVASPRAQGSSTADVAAAMAAINDLQQKIAAHDESVQHVMLKLDDLTKQVQSVSNPLKPATQSKTEAVRRVAKKAGAKASGKTRAPEQVLVPVKQLKEIADLISQIDKGLSTPAVVKKLADLEATAAKPLP